MATTNFKIFNEAMDADRTFNDSEYEQATQRINGVTPGMALSRQHNKMYRQWSAMCKGLADFIVNTGNDCLDTDVSGITTGLEEAIKTTAGNTEEITNAITAHNTSSTAHADIRSLITAMQASIIMAVYPVGALYISTVSTSPATLFGGNWERVKDKFLLSAGDSYAAGATGGEATHVLSTSEMPSHNHSGSTGTAGAHTHTLTSYVQNSSNWHEGNDGVGGLASITTSSNGDHTHSVSIGYTGDGSAHNNMPPYLAVYVWKRTA